MEKSVYSHDWGEPDHEIIIKNKGDTFDWIDPLQRVWILDGTLFVDNGRGVYEYILSDLVDYNIREYNPDNIYDYQGGNL